MHPSMEELYLPVFQEALYASREMDGEEQALISTIEYPTPPTHKNLDCNGFVAHATMQKAEMDKQVQGAICCARREIFEEIGVYIPIEFFNASSTHSTGLPAGLSFTHGPCPLPTKTR
jgi:hypothetical protein